MHHLSNEMCIKAQIASAYGRDGYRLHLVVICFVEAVGQQHSENLQQNILCLIHTYTHSLIRMSTTIQEMWNHRHPQETATVKPAHATNYFQRPPFNNDHSQLLNCIIHAICTKTPLCDHPLSIRLWQFDSIFNCVKYVLSYKTVIVLSYINN